MSETAGSHAAPQSVTAAVPSTAPPTGVPTATAGAAAAESSTGNARLDQFRKQLEELSVRGVIIRAYNIGVISIAVLSLLLTLIAWGVSINAEGGQLKRRHVGSIIAFICAVVTIVVDIASLHVQPTWIVLIALQVGSVVTLFLNGVAVGMNAISVDVCSSGDPGRVELHCSSHYLEYVAGVFLNLCFTSMFLTTQQKIVVFVDRGVLKGLGNRLSRL